MLSRAHGRGDPVSNHREAGMVRRKKAQKKKATDGRSGGGGSCNCVVQDRRRACIQPLVIYDVEEMYFYSIVCQLSRKKSEMLFCLLLFWGSETQKLTATQKVTIITMDIGYKIATSTSIQFKRDRHRQITHHWACQGEESVNLNV